MGISFDYIHDDNLSSKLFYYSYAFRVFSRVRIYETASLKEFCCR